MSDFDPPLSWDPGDPGWVPTSGYPFDDGSSPALTENDFDQAAVDLDLYRRAAARCTVSEPHRDADEDVPCSGCLLAAARQLAIPASHLSALASSASSARSAHLLAGAVDGAAGPCAGSAASPGPAAPPSAESNQPRAENPRLAEGGPVRPQTGR